jgi:hypothetical protein
MPWHRDCQRTTQQADKEATPRRRPHRGPQEQVTEGDEPCGSVCDSWVKTGKFRVRHAHMVIPGVCAGENRQSDSTCANEHAHRIRRCDWLRPWCSRWSNSDQSRCSRDGRSQSCSVCSAHPPTWEPSGYSTRPNPPDAISVIVATIGLKPCPWQARECAIEGGVDEDAEIKSIKRGRG